MVWSIMTFQCHRRATEIWDLSHLLFVLHAVDWSSQSYKCYIMLHQAARLLPPLCTLSPLNSNLCHSCNQLHQRDLVAPSSTTCRQMTFSISLSSEMIIITVLLVLTSKTAAYSTQNTIMRPIKSFFPLHAGFGQSKNKVLNQVSPVWGCDSRH